jgi:hypothetical protein
MLCFRIGACNRNNPEPIPRSCCGANGPLTEQERARSIGDETEAKI